jgi:hypothetical protein
MKKASEYLEHARECRGLAARAATDEQRQMLLKMAQTWATLAHERAARVAQKRRLQELIWSAANEPPESATGAPEKTLPEQ